MGPVIDLAQPLAVHVAVRLRRRERAVAEQLLDHPQVGAALEQVRRKGVTQSVRVREQPPERARVESPSARGDEQRVLGAVDELRTCRPGRAAAGMRPPRRAGRLAPCRPCPGRGPPPARSRRRRDRGRPPRGCAARPSRRARAARGCGARAARRPRTGRAPRPPRRTSAHPAGGARAWARAARPGRVPDRARTGAGRAPRPACARSSPARACSDPVLDVPRRARPCTR